MTTMQNLTLCIESSKAYEEAKEITMLISMLTPDQRKLIEGVALGMTLARQNA